MSKRIVFCADGTWDSSTKHTNVYKMYKSLVVSSDQMPFYDDGVGVSGGLIVKLLGGAFGTGLWRKIKEGYTKIAHVYEEGDELFLFGFSRGAFTARSLAGMIVACGLPTKDFTEDLVETAFDAYRDRGNRSQKLQKLANNDMFPAKIKMIGVWDTVGSLGIPSIFGGVDPLLYGFLDTSLHPSVLNAYQALAIDEMRCEFPPTLWSSAPAAGQTLEQVWFCGVHSDVGGGEPDDLDGATALSDIPLTWMMNKASALGLKLDATMAAQYAVPMRTEYALEKLHTSWSALCGVPRMRSIDKNALLANSVSVRSQCDKTWRPGNLSFVDGVLSLGYELVSVVGEPAMSAVS